MRKSFALALVLCVGCLLVQAQDRPSTSQDLEPPKVTKEKPISFWMAKKLDYSKSILEGLTSGDFKKMEQYAQQMQSLGQLEGFVRSGSPEYAAQMQMFSIANTDLVAQANKRNLEGAVLAFNHLTSSCVACHSDLRRK